MARKVYHFKIEQLSHEYAACGQGGRIEFARYEEEVTCRKCLKALGSLH